MKQARHMHTTTTAHHIQHVVSAYGAIHGQQPLHAFVFTSELFWVRTLRSRARPHDLVHVVNVTTEQNNAHHMDIYCCILSLEAGGG